MKIETILFDMDGVLVDVSQSYHYAIKKTAEFFTEEEIQFSEIQQFKNKGGFNNDWDCTHAIVSAHGKDVFLWEVTDKFQEYYLGKNFDGFIKNESWLLSYQILENLYNNFPLGIITGRPKNEAEYVLKIFDVADYFDVLVTLDDTPPGKRKPEPYGINLALKKLDKKQAIYLGDSVDDMKAATAAKITPIGIVTEKKEKQTLTELLKNAGAQFVIESVNDVTELLQ